MASASVHATGSAGLGLANSPIAAPLEVLMRLVPLKVVPNTEAEEHICPYRGRQPSIGCMRLRDVRRDELLSLEESYPSMGKMAGACADRSGGGR